MNLVVANLLSAFAISCVITLMAGLKESKLRALIYSLPIPITTALIATGNKINSFNIVGLLLVTLFIWGTFYLYEKKKWPILLVDVLLAIAYVVVAYFWAKHITLQFSIAAIAYLVAWVIAMIILKDSVASSRARHSHKVPLWGKSIIVFGMAYILFTLKAYLAGFVVTFPYSGVFAVFEGKDMLKVLSIIFTRNSIAIWVFFVADYMLLANNVNKWLCLGLSWLVFGAVLFAVMKLIPLKHVGSKPVTEVALD